MAEPEDEPPSVLLPCSICSRTFKPESLQKHIKVCEKQLTKKRKVFDSSKQRIQGTELAEFLPIILREKKSEKVPAKKQESKWKEKHLEFVRAIRAARGVEVESNKSVPAPRSNHEKCPHCDRNFGPKAFDRHVEWCKEQKARIPKSPGSLQAKERLEARTKYRAPPLAKSKRTLTREKYAKVSRHTQEMSPMGSRSIMTFSKMSPHNPQDSKTAEMNTKMQGMRNKPKVSASSPSCILPGGNMQIKRREPSPSPSKRPIRSKNVGKNSVLKEKSEDKHREHTFTTSNISKLQLTNEKVAREGKSHATDKSSSEEVYDPYASAERQMMELTQGDYVQPSVQQVQLSNTESSPVFPSFDSSRKSAFVRYSPPTLSHIPDNSLIPSALIAEFEDLFIAESQKHCYSVDNSINTDDQNKNIPLSLASIGLTVPNNNTDIAQPNRKPSKIRAKMESASLSLQRSVSLMNYENDSKVDIDANNFFQTDEDNIPLPVPSEFSSISFSSPEPHRTFSSSKSHFEKGDADKRVYEENCIYKLDTSTEPENKAKCYSTGGKFSADSAYGSLKRRSPGNQLPEKHDVDGGEGELKYVMSSSSSESSLPPLCSVQVLKSEASNPSSSPTPSLAVSASPVTQSVPRMSKFCHECGSKYPVSLAKFCCECGVRRLAM